MGKARRLKGEEKKERDARIVEMIERGFSHSDVADHFGVSRSLVASIAATDRGYNARRTQLELEQFRSNDAVTKAWRVFVTMPRPQSLVRSS